MKNCLLLALTIGAYIMALTQLDSVAPQNVMTLNVPEIILQTSGGGEIRLTYNTDYVSWLFDAGQFETVGLDILDRAMVGRIKAGGADENIKISADRHNATLTNGQTVYYGVKLTEAGMAKVDSAIFILKTAPISGVPDITRNFFSIKYAERIAGGGTDVGSINVRTESTSGKAFQVIRPAGNRLWYFSFTATAYSGGIRTVIDPHFFGQRAITLVTPNLLISGCNEIRTPLLDVPPMVYNCWTGGYDVDPGYLCQFKCQLAAKLKCNTDPYVGIDGEPSGNVYTVRIEGKQLPMGLTPADIAIGRPGDTQVLSVTESAVDHVTVTAKFLRTATGPLDVAITTPDVGTIRSCGLLRAAKLISDAPGTTPGELKFDGFRFVGVPDVLKTCQRVDGTHIVYASAPYQSYDIMPVCLNSERTALTTSTTGGECNNAFTNVEKGAPIPGDGFVSTSVTSIDTSPVIVCTMPKANVPQEFNSIPCPRFINGLAFVPVIEGGKPPRLSKDLSSATISENSDVRGALTDGVALVVVRFDNSVDTSNIIVTIEDNGTLSPRNNDTTAVGSIFLGDKDHLPPLPADHAELGNTSLELKGNKAFFFRPPPTWAFTERERRRSIVFRFKDANETDLRACVFELVRPPLLLVHGIFSSANTWTEFRNRISDTVNVETFAVNYENINSDGFDRVFSEVWVEHHKIIDTYNKDRKIAASRLDILGHSMGGSVTRWWFIAEEGESDREPDLVVFPSFKSVLMGKKIHLPGNAYKIDSSNSYGVGGVRLFMTVGTPHQGSKWADIASGNAVYISVLLDIVGISKNIDAVADLGSFGFTTRSTAAYYLSRSVVGVWSCYIVGISRREQREGVDIHHLQPTDNWVTLNDTLRFIFGDELNDQVVSYSSQANGRETDPPLITGVVHTQETRSARLRIIVRDLLQDRMLLLFHRSTNE